MPKSKIKDRITPFAFSSFFLSIFVAEGFIGLNCIKSYIAQKAVLENINYTLHPRLPV